MIFDAFQNAKVSVFYDVDSIPLGRDFRETIMTQVQKCDVLDLSPGNSSESE
jgi:hypothetical protein